MNDDLEEPAVVVHGKLLGGPAHGQTLTVSTHFTTIQVVVGPQSRAEYWQRAFFFRGRQHRAWCWPDLPEDELMGLAEEAFTCVS